MIATFLVRLTAVMLLAGCAAAPPATDETHEGLREMTRLAVSGAVVSDEHPDGAIKVVLNSILPDFKEYQVRIDNGGWQQSDATFVWTLRRGANRLQARAVSKSGLEGPVSTIELE